MTDCSKIGTNAGHGHAWQRPDGVKMRCGGPGLCASCSTDKQLMERCQATAVASSVDLETLKKAPYPSILEGTISMHVAVPAGLHHETRQMLRGFFEEVCEKARRAELKYGYENGWRDDSWQGEFSKSIIEHFEKGDPRDVAIFCAIGFSHGWPTYDPSGDVRISVKYEFKRTPDDKS